MIAVQIKKEARRMMFKRLMPNRYVVVPVLFAILAGLISMQALSFMKPYGILAP